MIGVEIVYRIPLPHGNPRRTGVIIARRHARIDVVLVIVPDACPERSRRVGRRHAVDRALDAVAKRVAVVHNAGRGSTADASQSVFRATPAAEHRPRRSRRPARSTHIRFTWRVSNPLRVVRASARGWPKKAASKRLVYLASL